MFKISNRFYYLIIANILTGLFDAYVWCGPLLTLGIIVFNFFEIKKIFQNLKKFRRLKIWIFVSIVPVIVCMSTIGILEWRMLKEVEALPKIINKYYEKNKFFPDKLSDLAPEYGGNKNNRIYFSGHFVVVYKYMKNTEGRWPIIEVKNRSIVYLFDSKTGKVIVAPREFLD